MVWINEKLLAGYSVSEAIICEKARLLCSDITRDTPGSSAEESKASKGWFDNFKKKTGIHSVVRHGEAASWNKDAAEKFVETLWIERDLFLNKYSIVTRQASSGKKCQKGPISQ
jgi:hypothetical protein